MVKAFTGESLIDQSIKNCGTCGYYRGFYNECGEVGCVLLPQLQGFGFMTNALQLSLAFGIKKIGLKRIIAITSPQNIKAMKLCERLGFIKGAEDTDSVHYEYLH